jgi:hypothetical protein
MEISDQIAGFDALLEAQRENDLVPSEYLVQPIENSAGSTFNPAIPELQLPLLETETWGTGDEDDEIDENRAQSDGLPSVLYL